MTDQLDSKAYFRMPFKILFTTERADEHGRYVIQLLDFARTSANGPVIIPRDHKRYGWIMRCDRPVPPTAEKPMGSSLDDPNDPLVGSEDTHFLALARAQGVRNALILPLNASAEAIVAGLKCKGCDAPMPDPVFEPCTICGEPVCDTCGAANNGVCGRDVVVEDGVAEQMAPEDRAVERTPEERDAHDREIQRRAVEHERAPMGSLTRTVEQEIVELTAAASEIEPPQEA